MYAWDYKRVSGNYLPRQFEYHPYNDSILFGCLDGGVSLLNEDKTITPLGHFGLHDNDVILGLCWFRNNSDRFICGSAEGKVVCGKASGSSYAPDAPPPSTYKPSDLILREYPQFEKLTSIHVNNTDDYLLLSGYTNNCLILDLETGKTLRRYTDIHSNHINISRFMHTSAHVFATSSFDKTVKLWDMRIKTGATEETSGAGGLVLSESKPIYTINLNGGVVMMSFAPNDTFLLTAGIDNEINQYYSLHGNLHMQYNVPKTKKDFNYTRAYYCNSNVGNSNCSGSHVLTGSSEETKVRFLSCTTGEIVLESELYPGRLDDSLYVQSMRSHPTKTNEATALVNYRDRKNRELIQLSYTASGIEDRIYNTVFAKVNNNSASDNSGVDALAASAAAQASIAMRLRQAEELEDYAMVPGEAEMLQTPSAAADVLSNSSPSDDVPGEGVPEDEELLELHNPLCTYPSKQLYSDMCGLRRVVRELDQTKDIGELSSSEGFVMLTVNVTSSGGNNSGEKQLIFPVHDFVLQCRCGYLWKQLLTKSSSKSSIKDSSSSHIISLNQLMQKPTSCSSSNAPVVENSGYSTYVTVHLSSMSFSEMVLVSQTAMQLLLDFLYTGALLTPLHPNLPSQAPAESHATSSSSSSNESENEKENLTFATWEQAQAAEQNALSNASTEKDAVVSSAYKILVYAKLLQIAQCLKLESLVTSMEHTLKGLLSIESCLLITEIAILHNHQRLLFLCKAFIVQHYDLVVTDHQRVLRILSTSQTQQSPGASCIEIVLEELKTVLSKYKFHYQVPLVAALVDEEVHEEDFSPNAPPICNGHSATMMMEDYLVSLGGRHINRCFQMKSVQVYNVKTRTWMTVATSGSGPVSQFYQVAAPVYSRVASGFTNSRYLLTCGGRICPSLDSEKNRDSYILDCQNFRWILPEEVSSAAAKNIGGHSSLVSFMCSAIVPMPFTAPKSDSDDVISTFLVFGGYFFMSKRISNETWLMVVTEKRKRIPVDKQGALDADMDGCDMESSEIHDNSNFLKTPAAVAKSCGHADPFSFSSANATSSDLTMDSISSDFVVEWFPMYNANQRKTNARFAPLDQRGGAPSPRMNHTATILQMYNADNSVDNTASSASANSSNSSGAAMQTMTMTPNSAEQPIRMLVYGGVGYTDIFGDVAVARYDAPRDGLPLSSSIVEWETVVVTGSVPEGRYGHTMVTLPHNGVMLMYGGRSDMQVEALSDLWELTFTHVALDKKLNLRWSQIDNIYAAVPRPLSTASAGGGDQTSGEAPKKPMYVIAPRTRHQAVTWNGEVLIFGGSISDLHSANPDETPDRNAFYNSIVHRRVVRLSREMNSEVVDGDQGNIYWTTHNDSSHLNEAIAATSTTGATSSSTTSADAKAMCTLLNSCMPIFSTGNAAQEETDAEDKWPAFTEVQLYSNGIQLRKEHLESGNGPIEQAPVRSCPFEGKYMQWMDSQCHRYYSNRSELGRRIRDKVDIKKPPTTLSADLLGCCNIIVNKDASDRSAEKDRFVASLGSYLQVIFRSSNDDEEEVELGAVSVYAPKALLSVRNAVLRALLSSSMSEARSGVVTLQCRSGGVHAALSLVIYLLTDVIAVRAEDVMELLALANQFTFGSLIQHCEYILCRQVDLSNVRTLLSYAECYHMKTLEECCMFLMLKHYNDFAVTFQIGYNGTLGSAVYNAKGKRGGGATTAADSANGEGAEGEGDPEMVTEAPEGDGNQISAELQKKLQANRRNAEYLFNRDIF